MCQCVIKPIKRPLCDWQCSSVPPPRHVNCVYPTHVLTREQSSSRGSVASVSTSCLIRQVAANQAVSFVWLGGHLLSSIPASCHFQSSLIPTEPGVSVLEAATCACNLPRLPEPRSGELGHGCTGAFVPGYPGSSCRKRSAFSPPCRHGEPSKHGEHRICTETRMLWRQDTTSPSVGAGPRPFRRSLTIWPPRFAAH